jgi:hypothetical protein
MKSQVSNLGIYLTFFLISISIIIGVTYEIFMVFGIISVFFLILFYRINKSVSLIFFLLPFSNIIKLGIFGSFSILNIFIILLLFKSFYIVKKNSIRFQSSLIIIILLFFFIIFINGGFFLETIKFSLFILFMVLYLLSTSINSDTKVLLVSSYSLGIIISSFFYYIFLNLIDFSMYVDSVTTSVGELSFIRFSGFTSSPNYYSLDVNIAMASLSVLFIQKFLSGFKYCLYLLPLVIFGILSGSKSFFITGIFIMIIVYIYVLKTMNTKNVFFITFGLFFFIFLILSLNVFTPILRRISYDLSDLSDLNQLLTNRDVIFIDYFNFLKSNPIVIIFGVGLGNQLLNQTGSHNFYIELIYHFGIIGTLFIFIIIINIYLIFSNKNKIQLLIVFLPLFTLFIRGLTINILLRDNFIFYLILIIILTKSNGSKKGLVYA